MEDFENLILKIEDIIEKEKSVNPDIKYLRKEHARLIAQIISSYGLKNKVNSSAKREKASMLFIGAPTGAGKDTLVRKVMVDNPDKNYVVLNMDMFRHYHSEITQSDERISDKEFALRTNQSSYELYYMIQEVLLREFPGTNVIITGTIKDLKWVKEIVSRYKKDEKTDYTTALLVLAVPTVESAFSIFERYLNVVDLKSDDNIPLRYTSLNYHNETVKDFLSNVGFFEAEIKSSSGNNLFDSLKVYRRQKDMLDLSEDTLIYDSEGSEEGKTALSIVNDIMNAKVQIDSNRIFQLLNIIKRNIDYLKAQGLYKEILEALQEILPQLNKRQDFSDVEKV